MLTMLTNYVSSSLVACLTASWVVATFLVSYKWIINLIVVKLTLPTDVRSHAQNKCTLQGKKKK